MEQALCSETSAHKIKNSGNHPKEITRFAAEQKFEVKEINNWIAK